MSVDRKQIEHLLQACLDGYDSGLSPEECLSAYPHVRAELEPLFRQALSLRVAYAATPSDEFKRRARENLLFAAGRDVGRAFAAEPDQDFVADARQRFLKAAGAQAQEALRDVPPPRLPFWVNARRRLLDTAASAPPRTVAQPFAFAMRMGLSAAVVVLAIMVATLGFFATSNDSRGPGISTASAQKLDYIEDKLDQVDQQRANGETVSPSLLLEITNITSELSKQPDAPVLTRLPALIERQKDVVDTAVATGDPQPELAEAKQNLSEAEVRVSAARAETPAPTSAAGSTLSASPTQTPRSTPSATPQPSPTVAVTPVTPVKPVSPDDIEPGQVLVQLDPTDTSFNLFWTGVISQQISFVMPTTWEITNIETDAHDLAVLPNTLTIQTPYKDVPAIYVRTQTGEVSALIDGENVSLRSEGKDGQVIELDKLRTLTQGLEPVSLLPILHHFLETLDQSFAN